MTIVVIILVWPHTEHHWSRLVPQTACVLNALIFSTYSGAGIIAPYLIHNEAGMQRCSLVSPRFIHQVAALGSVLSDSGEENMLST